MYAPSRMSRRKGKQQANDEGIISKKEYLVGYVEDFETPEMIERKFREMEMVLHPTSGNLQCNAIPGSLGEWCHSTNTTEICFTRFLFYSNFEGK